MEKKALVAIAPGSEDIEVVVIIDLLRRAGINTRVCGTTGIVTCSRGTKIIPDLVFAELETEETFDVIVLPGGLTGVNNLLNCPTLEELLKKHKERKAWLAAICAAPSILVEKKIISPDIAFTSHPSLKERFLHLNYSEERVVVSENFITSRGAGTTVEFALEIIKQVISEELANKIGKDIVHF